MAGDGHLFHNLSTGVWHSHHIYNHSHHINLHNHHTNLHNHHDQRTTHNCRYVDGMDLVEARYRGTTKNGRLEGHGTYTFGNGSVYEGDFLDGQCVLLPTMIPARLQCIARSTCAQP